LDIEIKKGHWISMKKTETSSFGVGKRESHDSSAFYERSLFDGVFAKPTPKKEMLKVKIPILPLIWKRYLTIV
jgi:hypothetical protein